MRFALADLEPSLLDTVPGFRELVVRVRPKSGARQRP
jgi:hypothetical protein